MKRNIIDIDEEKCTGCGLCINACHEGALKLVDGKARLISESYCDGLGNCLPECPVGAIKISEKDVAAFDEEAVSKHLEADKPAKGDCSCPGTRAIKIVKKVNSPASLVSSNPMESQLGQWPCQIKLVSSNAPYFDNAHLLIAADCTAYAYANFHNDFMRNRITLIGCPKLDEIDYSEKLTDIIKRHEILSITITRMEVPCCSGIVNAVKKALIDSGKMIPWSVITIGTDGSII